MLLRWYPYQTNDKRTGSQACQRWRPGTEYWRDGDLFPESLLHGGDTEFLRGKNLSADDGCHEGRGTALYGSDFLRTDADRGRAQGAGVQCPVRGPGGPGGSAQTEQ